MMSPNEKDAPTRPYLASADTIVSRKEIVGGTIAGENATEVSSIYAVGEVIGRGGMGEVLVAHDRRIGRNVALKRMRAVEPTEVERGRFFREARIQARLEHPAIVPVYELARDEAGRPFFTMKRVAGVTLSEVVASGGATRQRLLRAFAEICRAIDYAHSRSVVHRDLKPANIVLGEFGEVYVLDWGIARVVGDTPDGVDMADVDTLEAEAGTGDVIGTPGYGAPEQLVVSSVDRPADVYALGAILFEILTGTTLHPRVGPAAIASTLDATTVTSPARRCPDRDIPPELDRLCTEMLQLAPAARPTARGAAVAIEDYLDGDRDTVRRRVMAHDLAALAHDAYREGRGDDAMRIASRALALDPETRGAAELVMHLMLQPANELAPEVQGHLRRADGDAVSQHARAAVPGYVMIALFLPIIVWNGVRVWSVAIELVGLALILAVAAWDLTRRPAKSFAYMVAYALANSLLLAIMSRFVGPLIVVPALVAYATGSLITYPAFLGRKWLLIGIMLAGFLGPVALEASGVLAPTWEMTDAGMLTFGYAMHVNGIATTVTILLGGIVIVVMVGLQSARVGKASRAAHHRVVLQAYRLGQLLPVR